MSSDKVSVFQVWEVTSGDHTSGLSGVYEDYLLAKEAADACYRRAPAASGGDLQVRWAVRINNRLHLVEAEPLVTVNGESLRRSGLGKLSAVERLALGLPRGPESD